MELEKVFDYYFDTYKNVFDRIYPSTGSTGFTERNQTVNFSKAYEKIYGLQNCATWFEFEFNKNNHFDALIIDDKEKRILLLEAKRLTSVGHQAKSILGDIARIEKFHNQLQNDDRFQSMLDYDLYGMILADVWTETPRKSSIPNLFSNNQLENGFLEKEIKKIHVDGIAINEKKFQELHYYHRDFTNQKFTTDDSCISNNYHLLGFSWHVE